MLLINFIKKALVLAVKKQLSNAFLFIFFKVVFLAVFFFSQEAFSLVSKNTPELFYIQKQPEVHLEFQNQNYQIFIVLEIAFLIGLLAFFFIQRRSLKRIKFDKEVELSQALFKLKKMNELEEQQTKLWEDLCVSVQHQLYFIASSLDNLSSEKEVSQTALKNQIQAIAKFAHNTNVEMQEGFCSLSKK